MGDHWNRTSIPPATGEAGEGGCCRPPVFAEQIGGGRVTSLLGITDDITGATKTGKGWRRRSNAGIDLEYDDPVAAWATLRFSTPSHGGSRLRHGRDFHITARRIEPMSENCGWPSC